MKLFLFIHFNATANDIKEQPLHGKFVSIEIVSGAEEEKTGAIYESVSHTANLSVNWRHNAEYFALVQHPVRG